MRVRVKVRVRVRVRVRVSFGLLGLSPLEEQAPYISPISPLDLPCISVHLPYIST